MDEQGFVAETIRAGDEVVLVVHGEIDLASAPVFWERLAEAIPETRRLVVDLHDTTFLDSTALSTLVRALKRMRHAGGDLILRSPRPNARRILDLTHLDRVMTIEG